jgi:hypothetical protein
LGSEAIVGARRAQHQVTHRLTRSELVISGIP